MSHFSPFLGGPTSSSCNALMSTGPSSALLKCFGLNKLNKTYGSIRNKFLLVLFVVFTTIRLNLFFYIFNVLSIFLLRKYLFRVMIFEVMHLIIEGYC